jgi:phage major head subunit gpT-like protein
MLLTKATLQGLQTSFSNIHGKGWAMATPRLIEMATRVPSSTRTQTYGWMARLMKMRKWEGPRLIQNLNTHAYTLENEPYELTVAVDKYDIKDDMLGIYNPLFEELGRQSKLWPDTVLKTALQAGTTNLGFDGVAFFATTHPLNAAGNQSNNFAATALTAANFAVVRAAMMSYTDETGEPLGIIPDTLFVPPALADTANTIVTVEFGASGATNVQRGQARVVMVPQLANQATTWYLADTSSAIKPLVWQEREAPILVSKTDVDEEAVFWQKQFIWGIEARGAAGYGPWFLAARAIA